MYISRLSLFSEVNVKLSIWLTIKGFRNVFLHFIPRHGVLRSKFCVCEMYESREHQSFKYQLGREAIMRMKI